MANAYVTVILIQGSRCVDQDETRKKKRLYRVMYCAVNGSQVTFETMGDTSQN